MSGVVRVWLLFALLFPLCGHAYVGPGAGLSALGSVLAFVGTLLLLLLGFVWYPMKRLIRYLRARRSTDRSDGTE